MDWIALLKTVAPGIATALGGPLAGIAVSAIGNALGIPEPTQEKIQAAIAGATPDDLLKVKLAEQQFQKDMKSLDIQLDQINASDRDSARKLQASTRGLTVPVLSWLVVIACLGVEGLLLFGVGDKADINDMMLGRIMGTLDAALLIVLNFHFGSSSQSHLQTRIIAENGKK